VGKTFPKSSRISGGERREQIIDAAIQLFSAGGFAGTTTRRLAEAAGISEASLYLHFDTKEALYEAIIRRKASEAVNLTDRLRAMAEQHPREVFQMIAEHVIETHTRDQAFLRLLLYSGLEQHALFHMFFESHMREVSEMLRAYVERKQGEGVLRQCDPLLAVRAFMGMLVHHLLIQEIFRLHELGRFEPRQAATTFVGVYLDGMSPDAAPPRANGHETPSTSEPST
jgi:AcrR family transcriptional regulator